MVSIYISSYSTSQRNKKKHRKRVSKTELYLEQDYSDGIDYPNSKCNFKKQIKHLKTKLKEIIWK